MSYEERKHMRGEQQKFRDLIVELIGEDEYQKFRRLHEDLIVFQVASKHYTKVNVQRLISSANLRVFLSRSREELIMTLTGKKAPEIVEVLNNLCTETEKVIKSYHDKYSGLKDLYANYLHCAHIVEKLKIDMNSVSGRATSSSSFGSGDITYDKTKHQQVT